MLTMTHNEFAVGMDSAPTTTGAFAALATLVWIVALRIPAHQAAQVPGAVTVLAFVSAT